MRMWLVDPEILCTKHLSGEHVELHMIAGAYAKGHKASLEGLADAGYIDTSLVVQRHAELVSEMEKRGWNHKSPLDESLLDGAQIGIGAVDPIKSKIELFNRCHRCACNERKAGCHE